MSKLTPAEQAVVAALAAYVEAIPEETDDVDRAEMLRLAQLVLAAARPPVEAAVLRHAADTRWYSAGVRRSLRKLADEIEAGAS